jgi:hypothetical protein
MASQLSFRKAFHPSRSGLALGVLLLLAQWAVWLWLMTELMRPPPAWRAAGAVPREPARAASLVLRE